MSTYSYRFCFEADPVYFGLTNSDLEIIKSSSSILEREFCMALGPLSLACIINAISLIPKPFEWSLGIFLNSLIGGIAFLGCFYFGLSWKKNTKNLNKLYDEIKSKPIRKMLISESSEDPDNPIIKIKSSK